MTRRIIATTVCGLAIVPTLVAGQVCAGAAPFTAGSYQVFGGADFNDNAKSLSGGLAVGGAGPFGQFSVGRTTFDDVDGSSIGVGGGLGYQLALGSTKRVQLCPVVSVAVSAGPSGVDVFGDGSVVLDLSETDLSFGLTIGGVASESGGTHIVPYGSLALINATLKARDEVSNSTDSESEGFGMLGLGIGFIFNTRITLRPSVAIPFGLDGASTTFGISVGANFGQASSAP